MVTLHCASIRDYRDEDLERGIVRDHPTEVQLDIDRLFTGKIINYFFYTNSFFYRKYAETIIGS